MTMKLVMIEVYKTSTDKKPYIEWLNKLDNEVMGIITSRLNRIRCGNFGACNPIKGVPGVSELVLDVGPGYRVYFGNVSNSLIIILLGGIKKTQARDIEKSRIYWLDYREKNNG